MKRDIQWSSNDDGNSNNKNPWERPKPDSFRDLILKQEFRSRRLRFEPGQTWLRIVPAFASSSFGWMLGVHSLGVPGVLFAHPRTIRRNTRSVFDEAYKWLHENEPSELYSKANRDGVRLLSDPVCLFWALVEQGGRYVARLVQASGYDGCRGGTPGLGHQILRLTQSQDETGELMAEPVHPEHGVLIAATKTKPPGAKYPNYTFSVGRQPTPMDAILERTEPAEIEAICPLEEVVQELRFEQELELLSQVLKPEHFDAFSATLRQ